MCSLGDFIKKKISKYFVNITGRLLRTKYQIISHKQSRMHIRLGCKDMYLRGYGNYIRLPYHKSSCKFEKIFYLLKKNGI